MSNQVNPLAEKIAQALHEQWRKDEYNPLIFSVKQIAAVIAPLLPEGDGWIPCAERMPEIGAMVIVWACRNEDAGKVSILEYTKESEEHQRIIRHDGQWWNNGTRITHWRPLPPAPAPEAGKENTE